LTVTAPVAVIPLAAVPGGRVLVGVDEERDARSDRRVVAARAGDDLGLHLAARQCLDVDGDAARQDRAVFDLGARLGRREHVERDGGADADALRVLGLGVCFRQVELVRLRLHGYVCAARAHVRAGADECLRVVVQDDVDGDGARDADIGLAGARVRLGADLVLGEAEERVGSRARRDLRAVADR
jgi:hypothetical protein